MDPRARLAAAARGAGARGTTDPCRNSGRDHRGGNSRRRNRGRMAANLHSAAARRGAWAQPGGSKGTVCRPAQSPDQRPTPTAGAAVQRAGHARTPLARRRPRIPQGQPSCAPPTACCSSPPSHWRPCSLNVGTKIGTVLGGLRYVVVDEFHVADLCVFAARRSHPRARPAPATRSRPTRGGMPAAGDTVRGGA